MSFDLGSFSAALRAHVPAETSGLLVAYSGGLDSTVLLHAVAALRANSSWPVRAIHVDHQLHADSARWAEHCELASQALGVPFERCTVSLKDSGALGIEAAAREARYAALRQRLRSGETLLTAQHADDQAETLLLALMRGTGVRGLAGMPSRRRFGAGWHVRPLLGVRRRDLEQWARERALTWLDDPSNTSDRFARNHLRVQILPRLEQRWPSVVRQLERTAGHLAESAELLDHLAGIDAQQCVRERCLDLDRLSRLDTARQRNLLRWWLRAQDVRSPSTAQLEALQAMIASAAIDRVPFADLDGVRVFRHRSLLYAEAIERVSSMPEPCAWSWHEPLALGEGAGHLRAVETHGAGLARRRLPDVIDVRFRSGGERVQMPGASTHRTLKNLLQEADVLPWWRDRVPILFVREQLCAVADLWIDATANAKPDEAGVKIVWEDKPSLYAVQSAG
jgi:tRNA(Ile)-lysidine synthase